MTPLELFEGVWDRCAEMAALHAYLEKNVSSVLRPDELLRAEWVARLSALDLYVHELIAQLMLAIFEGQRLLTPAYLKFRISNESLDRIRAAGTPAEASATFDLEVREQLAHVTFQDPEKIADGVRLCSQVELWNEVALQLGATEATKIKNARTLKKSLSLVVDRRNKIAHEGDLQPTYLREPWPISRSDVDFVKSLVEQISRAIDAVVQ